MKKLSFLGNLAVGLGFSLLVVSCQKQQDAVTTDTPTDAAVIKNISGETRYSGKISATEAEEMSNTYKGTASKGATEYVTFKIADLKAFLAALEASGKTDEVNVNLAIYDSKTAPDKSLDGRTTIFFGPGAPKSRTRGSGGRIDHGIIVFSDNADYMNHGQIWP